MKTITDILSKLSFSQFFCLFISTGCFVYFFWISYMAFHSTTDMPTDVSEIKMAIIGAFSLSGGYIFGTTNSSSKKDAIIGKAIDGK